MQNVASGDVVQETPRPGASRPSTRTDDISPKSTHLTIATVTMQPSQEAEQTCLLMRNLIQQTLDKDPNVRLFLFGESILGWFNHPDGSAAYHRSIAEPIPGPSTDAIAQTAKEERVYICFGMTERGEEGIHNSQVLISPEGQVVAVHRKFLIMNPAFTPGELRLTRAEVDGVNVALLVCADVRSQELLRAIRRARVDVVLAGLADYSTNPKLSQMIGTFFDAWAFTANRFGQEGKMRWSGITTITDPWARLMQFSVGSECVLIQEVPIKPMSPAARKLRRTLVFFKGIGLALAMAVRMLWKSATG